MIREAIRGKKGMIREAIRGKKGMIREDKGKIRGRIGLVLAFAAMLTRPAAGEVGEGVEEFLRRFEEGVGKMDTYSCLMLSENWKGAKHRKNLLRFYFKKPNLMRTDVLEGKKRGSTVLINKKGVIRGRNSWGLRKTLRPTDRRLCNIRGYTFMNSSLSDKSKRLNESILTKKNPAALSEERWRHTPAYRLHIEYPEPDPADPVTSEDIWFHKETLFMLKDVKYEGKKRASDVAWSDIEINIPLDDSLFEQ